MSQTSNNLAAYIWSLADLLRGDFKQSQYGRIILPFTLLRRLECVLEASKPAVLAEYEKIQQLNVSEEAQEKLLLRATKLPGATGVLQGSCRVSRFFMQPFSVPVAPSRGSV